MAAPPPPIPSFNKEKTPWWQSNKKVVGKYIKEAKPLVSSPDQNDVAHALQLLDAALALSPGHDLALDLKARSLLHLRRFKDVADMLQDFLPTPNTPDHSSAASVSSSLSSESSRHLAKDRVRLLSSRSFHFTESQVHLVPDRKPPRCFSISDFRNRILAGIRKKCDSEGGQWRYLVLGQALCHLGLMEDAMVLLQTGKRLASAAFRRESICRSDDSFTTNFRSDRSRQLTPPRTDAESISQLITHIKLLLRRKTAALAALDAGLYTEAIRYLTKVVEGRRSVPQGFLAECYMHRALAYRSAGRLAESISDCNRTLALDPTCIEALQLRASILETLWCFPDCLHDLEHLKLLYNSILRDRKLPGPVWKQHRHNVSYREIPGQLCVLATKIQKVKQNILSGDQTGNVDYYSLIGLSRGCSRVELQRSHLLLCIKHKPDKAIGFIENCEFGDDCDIDSVKDRARLSALMLYRLLQKGYKSVMATFKNDEAADTKQSRKVQATTSHAAAAVSHTRQQQTNSCKTECSSVFQGVFCRDVAVVGSCLVSQPSSCNRQVAAKSDALTC
uniref:Uncharacterized protein n=1 Tax=Kalanchoe fedtschenkoi TaxID=63787 RepID=A0A7N0TLT0_KALFE